MQAADSLTGEIVECEAGRLSALLNVYPVDGRVSWHPPGARGFATMNCYLLVAGDHVVLCDTGLTIHREALLAQLRASLQPSQELSLLLLRQGEFDSMCNLAPIVKELEVKAIHGQYADAPEWADIHGDPDLRMSNDFDGKPPTLVPSSRDVISVDPDGERQLDIFVPALRLLGTYWVYDRETRTLFTSDSFSYAIRPDASGPWVLTEDSDATTSEQIEEHLVGTRYWWLPGAKVDGIRADLAQVFEDRPIERIAPGFGCILEGRSVVERHYAMVDDVVRRLGTASGDRESTSGGRA